MSKAADSDSKAAFLVAAARQETSPRVKLVAVCCEGGEQLKMAPLPPQGGDPFLLAEPAAPLPQESGTPPLPKASRKVWSLLCENKTTTYSGYLNFCKVSKKRLTCFIQPICVKRQKEVFCRRNQMNTITVSKYGGFLVERGSKRNVLYPCKQEEERERKKKSR